MWWIVALVTIFMILGLVWWWQERRRVRIVISMTTIPSRLGNLDKVLEAIIDKQTVKPDVVYLNVPHVFGRTGEL